MKKLIVCGLAVTMLLAGCGAKPAETTVPPTEAPTTVATEATTEPTTVPTTEATEPAPVDVNPLTGEALDEVKDLRPIAVMLNNHSKALPQCGISKADILYEILAEGATTRMTAVFSDARDADAIGPVRSLRAYYLNIMRGYDALCVSAGGSREADNMVYNLGYDRINGIGGAGAGYFYRDSWRRQNRGYEHSLFIKGEDLYKGAEEGSMRTTEKEGMDYGLTFDDSVPFGGEEIGKITVHFRDGGKTTTMTYDKTLNGYTGFQQGADLIDGNTEKAVVFRNVLVLFADTGVMDGEGHLKVQTTGEGKGYYARDGKLVDMIWKRADEDAPFEYYDAQGNEIVFGVGKTYAAVIPTGSPVDLAD